MQKSLHKGTRRAVMMAAVANEITVSNDQSGASVASL